MSILHSESDTCIIIIINIEHKLNRVILFINYRKYLHCIKNEQKQKLVGTKKPTETEG